MVQEHSDAGLIAGAIDGDSAALSTLLRQYGPRLREQITIDPRWQSVIDVDDVLQVTYMEAFLKIDSFTPGGPNAFPGWLKRIAENNLRDAIRMLEAQRRPPPAVSLQARTADGSVVALLELIGVSSATPSREAAQGELRTALDVALAQMPADYAAAIRKYDLEGLSIAEVATAMGRSTAAVHMLRARGHDRLKELLGSGSQFFSNPV